MKWHGSAVDWILEKPVEEIFLARSRLQYLILRQTGKDNTDKYQPPE